MFPVARAEPSGGTSVDRTTIIHWLEEHPQPIGRDPAALVDRCEREVKRHASEDAWLTAKAYVEECEHEWEHSWGFPRASETFVALEVCRRLARELQHIEPQVELGDERHLVGEKLMRSLDPQARAKLGEWARELAESEEHQVWDRIVRFTRAHGRALARQGLLSNDVSPESGNYFAKAAGIAHRLVEEFEAHAHPHPRRLRSH
jgi:hypothetical protein